MFGRGGAGGAAFLGIGGEIRAGGGGGGTPFVGVDLEPDPGLAGGGGGALDTGRLLTLS